MADESELSQNEIERLLNQAKASPPPSKEEPKDVPSPGNDAGGGPLDQSEIEALLGGGGGGTSPDPEPPSEPHKSGEKEPASQAPPPASAEATAVQTGTSVPTSAEVDDADKLLAQDDIEALLSKAGKGAAATKQAKSKQEALPQSTPGEGDVAQGDIDYLLNQAEEALRSIDAEGQPPAGVKEFRLEEFSGAPPSTEAATLDLIRDVDLDLKIELGRTHMYLEDVLKLRKGSVVPLDKLAGDPVDIYVNGRLIARGEVLVLNDNFCVRVAELIAGESLLA